MKRNDDVSSRSEPAARIDVEDVGQDPAARRLRDEFPRAAAVWDEAIDRRRFLQIMGASLALAGLGGCSRKPGEAILPYVEMPEHMTHGLPQFYATAMPLDGDAVGLLAESNMGRPTKLEGNPRHPANRGGTDVFSQAAVLDLWDPDRSAAVRLQGRPASWGDLQQDLLGRLDALGADGKGLCLLTGAVTSPSLADLIGQVRRRFPSAGWYRHVPLDAGHTVAGATAFVGRTALPRYDFARADVVFSIDADPLAFMPGHLRHARDFAARRRPERDAPAMSRYYAVESVPGLTGAMADHRLPLRASAVEPWLTGLAALLGVGPRAEEANAVDDPWMRRLAGDLREHRGRSLVVPGERQPPSVHLLAHAVNRRLGNIGHTVSFTEPADYGVGEARSMSQLTDEMAAGRVKMLLILDTNPVYTAGGDRNFGVLLDRVPFSLHHGLYNDETARRCRWHAPQPHFLEEWGDCRDQYGTVTLRQPVIDPVRGGRSAYELLGTLLGRQRLTAREAVRGYWKKQRQSDFETFWKQALRTGVAGEETLSAIQPGGSEAGRRLSAAAGAGHGGWEAVFIPDRSVWDGRFANNAWLQEFPDPLTRQTWGNAVLIAPGAAGRLGVRDGDELTVRHGGRELSGPALLLPGMADRTVGLPLGYGRERAGRVGDGIGFDAYRLRTADTPWVASGVQVESTGAHTSMALVQDHHRMEGRDLVRHATLKRFRRQPDFARPRREEQPSLYPPVEYNDHKWGMSIDLNACIGCGACVVACQAENNIPVVGAEQVEMGREMHWLRVDRYHAGTPGRPRTLFQPVPCMQCELAPCEPVCPVEASVHDFEGINVQVYNRCIGTRFCSNNCPYKVRRFNFLQYAQDVPSLNAQRNPQVTVRQRGVMEKCNYCLQRIANGRALAKLRNRPLADGDVQTACQTACPTDAIVFGDLNDPDSRVSRRKASPLDYGLLEELGTRPRTTYAARVVNSDVGEDDDAV